MPTEELTEGALAELQAIGSNATTIAEIVEDPVVENWINAGIRTANEYAVSNAQRVNAFKILPRDFSVPTGELTSTLKLKRRIVYQVGVFFFVFWWGGFWFFSIISCSVWAGLADPQWELIFSYR